MDVPGKRFGSNYPDFPYLIPFVFSDDLFEKEALYTFISYNYYRAIDTGHIGKDQHNHKEDQS